MNFKELKEAVFLKTPMLRQLLEKHGDKSLLDYFTQKHTSSPPPSERQAELLSVIKNLTKKLIDPAVSDSVVRELTNHYAVSTADHHGPITHPFFVNSHLVQSYAHTKNLSNNIIVFSCGGISINNSSFPRGLLFHDSALEKKRMRFISLKHRHHPVYAFPAYTKNNLIQDLPPEPLALQSLVKEIYEDAEVWKQAWYSDQISRTNYLLWKKIPGQENKNLIYLEQETIVNELLCHFHLNQDTLITRLLTHKDYLKAFEECFDGIQGALSSEDSQGTVVFWAIHDNQRKQMRRHDDILETIDKKYTLKLTPENIRAALEKKLIMPSMALSFIILSFYYGITCGGGFLQISYLTRMKEAYINFLKKINHVEELKNIETLQTDYFRGEFVFATITNQIRQAHASAIDLILYGNTDTDHRLQELASVCKLGEAVDQMMPEFYKILYGTETLVEPSASPALSPSLYV